ncbi:hypothetical protein AB0G02_18645 [Actinosynnema sp. NPDC023658]|uniref:hypothetical protein n=1 Tax=Actinosynnema sp. NPDC023658 TaxID=3155465 RepID=UPI00340887C4
MLKKASTVAAVVAGMMLVGAPAFALSGEPHEHGHGNGHGHSGDNGHESLWTHESENGDTVDQFGLLNFGNDSDVASNLNVCETEVNVIGIPVLSQNDENACVNTDNDD